jgi:hypothetical protein
VRARVASRVMYGPGVFNIFIILLGGGGEVITITYSLNARGFTGLQGLWGASLDSRDFGGLHLTPGSGKGTSYFTRLQGLGGLHSASGSGGASLGSRVWRITRIQGLGGGFTRLQGLRGCFIGSGSCGNPSESRGAGGSKVPHVFSGTTGTL